MPIYLYKYKLKDGKKRSGELTADSTEEVRKKLNRTNIVTESISIKEKTKMNAEINMPTFEVVTPADVAIFTRQFSVLLDASVELTRSFDILAREIEKKKFKTILMDVKERIEGGTPIAQALGAYPKHFDSLYVNMVASGEQSSNLPQVFARLADYMEKTEYIKHKVKSAMTYPVIVSIAAVAMVTFMLTSVVPTFKDMFADMGGKLPAPTLLLFNASEFMKHNFIFIILIVAAIIITHNIMKKKVDKYNWFLAFLALKIPVAGNITIKNAMARFSRTLSTLMDSGLDLPEALKISSKTTGNRLYEEAIMEAREAVMGGQSLTMPLKEAKIFPGMMLQMIDAGQEAGKTGELLTKVADFYESEVDVAVDGLMAALEPIIMLVLGGVVGFIVIAMFAPILSMSALA